MNLPSFMYLLENLMIKKTTCQDLNNKTAIIIGASSGIGKAIAHKLAEHDCSLILLGISDDKGQAVTKELSEVTKVEYYHADISSRKDLETVSQKLSEREINFLINVSGISISQEKGVVDEANFDHLVDVNMKGVYLASIIFGHHLLQAGGSIVNISSIRAKTGTPSFSSGYAAAKAGVENLTKSFALELADKQIRVNAIAPGATFPTKISQKWSEELKKEIIKSIPLGRLARPEDIANGAYFLVSDLSNYITGQTLNINGGAWMG